MDWLLNMSHSRLNIGLVALSARQSVQSFDQQSSNTCGGKNNVYDVNSWAIYHAQNTNKQVYHFCSSSNKHLPKIWYIFHSFIPQKQLPFVVCNYHGTKIWKKSIYLELNKHKMMHWQPWNKYITAHYICDCIFLYSNVENMYCWLKIVYVRTLYMQRSCSCCSSAQ